MKSRLPVLLGLAAGLASSVYAGYVDEWARMKSLVPRGYVCFRATNSIVPDGRLTEPTWQVAPWTLDFLPITGQTNAAPPIRARARLLWDSARLYLAAELEPLAPRTRIGGLEASGALNPELRVVLDRDGDGHDYYELTVSTTAAVRSCRYDKPPKDGGQPGLWPQSNGVQAGVQMSQPSRSAPGSAPRWTIELAMPWQTLGLAAGIGLPEDREQWRLNMGWTTGLAAAGRPADLGPAALQLWVWSPHGVADLHRPERWGYLQFSRKRGTRAAFIPDPSLAARNALQGVYYAQKDFHARHGRWAVSLADLGYRFELEPGLEQAPVIRLTPEGFEATLDGPMQGLRPLRWHISHDGRFWADAELRFQLRRYYQSVPDSLAEP